MLDKISINNNSDDFLTSKNSSSEVSCYQPWIRPTIHSDGTVRVCPHHQTPLGNIKNKSFREIWFGEDYDKFRKNMINGNLQGRCKNCKSPLAHYLNKEIIEKLKSTKF